MSHTPSTALSTSNDNTSSPITGLELAHSGGDIGVCQVSAGVDPLDVGGASGGTSAGGGLTFGPGPNGAGARLRADNSPSVKLNPQPPVTDSSPTSSKESLSSSTASRPLSFGALSRTSSVALNGASRTAPAAQSLPLPLRAPKTSSSRPISRTSSEVGLGLMLDDESSQPGSGGRGRPSTDYGAQARGSDYLARLNRSPSVSSSAQDDSRPTTPTFEDGLQSWGADSFVRPRGNSSSSRLARISTTGGSANPLMIYTGSSSPSLTSSPRAVSPGPGAAHLAQPTGPYPRPGSAQSNASYQSALSLAGAAATSIPMSRPGSTTATSVGMDRTSSASKSRGGADPHSRHQSLTSACAPVTSGYATPSLVGEGQGSPTVAPRGWKQYDWGASTPTSKDGTNSPPRAGDDDPRRKAASSSGGVYNGVQTLIGLPATILGFFLAPLTSHTSSVYYSPALSASTAPTPKGAQHPKRYSLVVRLLTVSYLAFSTLFFAARLLNYSSPQSSSAAAARLKALRIGPRADALVGLAADAKDVGTEWAKNVAGGAVRWTGRATAEDAEEVAPVDDELAAWATVKRVGISAEEAQDSDLNPLTSMTHTYRFSKMHDKIHWDLHDEIVSFAFKATGTPAQGDVTACLYSNEAWLSTLPAFVKAWGGPISLVFETAHSRTSEQRPEIVAKIQQLRERDILVRELVDFHLVGTPTTMAPRTQAKTRERLIADPRALNFHHNLARFFAPTEIVFMVGDARFVPSTGLRRRLLGSAIKELVMEDGDAIVVPTFAFVRDPTSDPSVNKVPSLTDLREELGLGAPAAQWDGVSLDEYEQLAQAHVSAMFATLPLQPSAWPTKKSTLVSLVSTRIGTPESPSPAQLALFDRRWDLNHGPSNWYLWRKSSVDPRLAEPAEVGGGIGLGVDGRVGGGSEVYRVMDYDLHYSPNVVISRKGQPWCTERFDHLQAACVYQMYLSGAGMWVLPDEWLHTIEEVEKTERHAAEEDPADKLKKSISSRLYGKFHQEACMHYGREFLSIQMWNSEKAQQLRETCARTLSSWGMGAV